MVVDGSSSMGSKQGQLLSEKIENDLIAELSGLRDAAKSYGSMKQHWCQWQERCNSFSQRGKITASRSEKTTKYPCQVASSYLSISTVKLVEVKLDLGNASKKSKKSDAAEITSKNKHDVKVGGESSTGDMELVDAEMDEDKLEKKEGKKTFRSNLKPTVEVLEKLVFTEAQEAVLRKTKFWNFIEEIKQGKVGKAECIKSPRALEFIIRNFDPKELAFKIGDQVFKTDANHLAIIFKMQRIRNSEQDKKLYGPKEDPSLKTSEFYKKYFLEPKRRDEEEKKKDEKKKAEAKEKKRKEKNIGDKLDKKYIVEGIHTAMNEEGT
ncbi:uncharacterized protein LOC113336240 [Papaver somniferum]|uniref:uncharacterized protein LOC113336240 n=1 Tax=Papaver somniferum TaxID=3469 RepID=UPI000E6FE3D6|nr:uncharacterized protein LOC113336240 [Papaver somniferum]